MAYEPNIKFWILQVQEAFKNEQRSLFGAVSFFSFTPSLAVGRYNKC
jgi:hypothetical protein